VVFDHPILGTYELVGFITAMAVGLALAYCAFQDAHIAVGFIIDRLPQRVQSIIDTVVHGVSFIFWASAVWYFGKFAQAMKIKGLVSPSAEIPVYPFIYLVALGLSGLCLVLLFKFLVSFREILGSLPLTQLSPGLKTSETAKRVV
jgi:TRAP-type C4-dicarboxylate transport system permease small subunit